MWSLIVGGRAVFWDGSAIANCRVRGRLRQLAIACLIAGGVCGLPTQPARADDGEAPKPAPRTNVAIGGASIVLIASSDHLYAFVDRIEDNAPVADATLSIDSADGTSLQISKAADGLFVAPFNRAGHMHDAFMVSLQSAAGSGDAPAEIAYDDLPDAAGGEAAAGFGTKLAIALVSGGIGAIGAAWITLRFKAGRRRTTMPPAGSAQTT